MRKIEIADEGPDIKSIHRNTLTEPEKRRIRLAISAGVTRRQLMRQYRMSWDTIEKEIGK